MSPAATAAEWRAKYVEAADMLAETRAELDDFVHSSKELEEELLRELERNEKVQKDLKDKVIAVEADRDNWKVRSSVFHIRFSEQTVWLVTVSFYVSTNKLQYYRKLPQSRTRHPPPGIPKGQGPAARARTRQ